MTATAKGYRHGKLVVTLLVIACVPRGESGVAATPFGHWVGEHKRALRFGVILIPAVIFLLGSSPSLTVLIVLTAIPLVLLLAIEVLGRAPPAHGAPTSAT